MPSGRTTRACQSTRDGQLGRLGLQDLGLGEAVAALVRAMINAPQTVIERARKARDGKAP